MSVTQECKSCRYAVVHDEHMGAFMCCHRNAPVVGGTSEGGFTAWPKVGQYDWCGEYERNIKHVYPKERIDD